MERAVGSKPRKTRICANFKPPAAAQLQPRGGRGYTGREERWEKAGRPPGGWNSDRDGSRTGRRSTESSGGAREDGVRRGSPVGVGRGRRVTLVWDGVQIGRGRRVETELKQPGNERVVMQHNREPEDKNGGESSVDSRAERLSRYLCNDLNIDSDSDEEDGGFILGDDDRAELSDISSGDCVTEQHPKPQAAVTHSTSVKTEVAANGSSSTQGVGSEGGQMSPDFALVEGAVGQLDNGPDDIDNGCYMRETSLPVGEVVSEDDGWNSDDNNFYSNFPSHSAAVETPNLPSYVMYEDDVWVDEAKAVFGKQKKDDSKELQELLTEMFSLHTDVYSLILAFVKRAGKTRQLLKSLPRIALASFKRWLKEREGDQGKEEEEEESLKKPPLLCEYHQKGALSLMTNSHLNLMDDLCLVFQLHSANTDLLIDLVHNLLAEGKRKEAVTYVWTFRLQSHFSMEEMLLPLIGMDKINLIENYIEGDQSLQEDFVMLLDRLCHSGGLLSCAQRLGLEINTPNTKLCSKQLFKLALRLVKMYNLQLDKFPGLASQRRSIDLHHLLRMRYLHGNITEANMADLVEAAVRAHPGLPQLLARELIRMGEREAAAYWALQYSLPTNSLPLDVQILVMSGATRDVGVRERSRDEGAATADMSHDYLQFPLSTDCIHFISDAPSLKRCRNRLTQKGALIGVDAEWRLPMCNGWEERMAVLQLAVSDSVYLLDMLALPHCVPHSELRAFTRDVFSNPSTLKLGYSIGGDLDLFSRSWPFAAEVLGSPARVVDIKTLAAMVDSLSSTVQTPPSQPPPHPLLPGNPPGPLRTLLLHTPPSTTATRKHHRSRKQPPPGKSDPLPPQQGEEGEEDPLALEMDQHKGLSLLVHRELGRPLDKSQQISDWEKRPLSTEQLRYAALDALCLLQLYSVLTVRGLSVDPHFNTEPCIPSHTVTNRRSKE